MARPNWDTTFSSNESGARVAHALGTLRQPPLEMGRCEVLGLRPPEFPAEAEPKKKPWDVFASSRFGLSEKG